MAIPNNKLLFDDSNILIVSPTLAKVLGLGQAVFVQQLHFWLKSKSKNPNEDDYEKYFHDGKWWNYKTLEGQKKKTKSWAMELPFFHRNTIHNYIEELSDLGIIIKGNFNVHGYDRTIWYTIDEEKLYDYVYQWHKDNGEDIPEGIDGILDPSEYFIGSPRLAVALGGGNNSLSEALIVQFVHSKTYYLKDLYENDGSPSIYKKYCRDDEWYQPMTQKDWAKTFPFISASSIKRGIRHLCDLDLLKKVAFDPTSKTVSYTVNYPSLKVFMATAPALKTGDTSHKNDPTLGQKCKMAQNGALRGIDEVKTPENPDKTSFDKNDPTLGQKCKMPFDKNDPTLGQKCNNDTKDILKTLPKNKTTTGEAFGSSENEPQTEASVVVTNQKEDFFNKEVSQAFGTPESIPQTEGVFSQKGNHEAQAPWLPINNQSVVGNGSNAQQEYITNRAKSLLEIYKPTDKDVIQLLELANYNIEELRTAIDHLQNTRATNPIGWLITYFREDWHFSRPTNRKTDFNNFHERDYDMEALEAKLLNKSRLTPATA